MIRRQLSDGVVHKFRLWGVAVLAAAVLGLAVFVGIRTLQGSCIDVKAHADAPTTRHAEAALFLREVTSLYENQRYNAAQDQPLPRPLKATVSDHFASLWVSKPMYAGDFAYAQLWQHVYQRYHHGARCVNLHVLWKNGGVSQRFPPDTL